MAPANPSESGCGIIFLLLLHQYQIKSWPSAHKSSLNSAYHHLTKVWFLIWFNRSVHYVYTYTILAPQQKSKHNGRSASSDQTDCRLGVSFKIKDMYHEFGCDFHFSSISQPIIDRHFCPIFFTYLMIFQISATPTVHSTLEKLEKFEDKCH